MIAMFNFGFRPGAYEFDAKRDRKVKFYGSFGGPQTLITSVVIKCNEFGEPDTVSIDRYKIRGTQRPFSGKYLFGAL